MYLLATSIKIIAIVLKFYRKFGININKFINLSVKHLMKLKYTVRTKYILFIVFYMSVTEGGMLR